ncbi:unnamed protein product [Schistosoma rodhaini]|uniref:C2H2-type domain-containing protein n=1 Tax=Schistosoma mansoni TaxID=6183 RepID=A0A5K4F0Y6_SCHMA|nr:unnamed protein product [Schistosoma rodhaini]
MNPPRFLCSVCNVWCDTENVLRLHEMGKKHRSKCLVLDSLNTRDHIDYPLKISLPTLVTPDSGSPRDSLLDTSSYSTGTVRNSTCDQKSPLYVGFIDSSSNWTKSNELSSASEISFNCNLCGIHLNSSDQYISHLRGRKHQSKINVNSVSSLSSSDTAMSPSSDENPTSVFYHCNICQFVIFNSMKLKHLESEEHRLNVRRLKGKSLSPGPRVDNSPHLRKFKRSCREVLVPVYGSIKFTSAEAKLLENSAKGDQDCVLLLDSFDGRDRIAIHLANALLIANKNLSTIDPSSPSTPTWVVWVLPKIEKSSANSISIFGSQSDNKTDTSQRPLKIAYLPCDTKLLPQVDLIFTTSDLFVEHLSILLMRQAFICGIIIHDVGLALKNEEFCKLLYRYRQHFTNQANRGRIICFGQMKVEDDSVFSSFTQYG